jgi:hypothetical protein
MYEFVGNTIYPITTVKKKKFSPKIGQGKNAVLSTLLNIVLMIVAISERQETK